MSPSWRCFTAIDSRPISLADPVRDLTVAVDNWSLLSQGQMGGLHYVCGQVAYFSFRPLESWTSRRWRTSSLGIVNNVMPHLPAPWVGTEGLNVAVFNSSVPGVPTDEQEIRSSNLEYLLYYKLQATRQTSTTHCATEAAPLSSPDTLLWRQASHEIQANGSSSMLFILNVGEIIWRTKRGRFRQTHALMSEQQAPSLT